MKRSAFRIYCPARTAARGTISGRRPPVRVPWPYGITVQLVPESKFDSASHVLARSLFVQPKHAQTSLRPYGRDSGAHYKGRADGQPKLFFHPRAHIQIQTDVQTEPRTQKPSERNIKFYPAGILFHVKQPLPNQVRRTVLLTTNYYLPAAPNFSSLSRILKNTLSSSRRAR